MRSASLTAIALRALALTVAGAPLSLALAGAPSGASPPAKPQGSPRPHADAGDAGAAEAEQRAVAATVELYLQGHATGDGALWRRAFHPEAKLFWVKDGQLAQRTAEEFAASASGRPAADEARRARKISSLDIAGDAAMVKVELRYPEVTFIDYLSLLKLDGQWRIVHKIFHRRDRATAAPAALPSRP